jgi:argininosuccinate lyase
MPQKRNPDPFELVRAHAAGAIGALAGALGTTTGIAFSYHRDLQETKSIVVRGVERGLAALDAFGRALSAVHYNAAAMEARANDGYTVATDVADALIARGVTARRAHELVGAAVARAESERRPLNANDLSVLAVEADIAASGNLVAPLDARASIHAKKTTGSTAPSSVAEAIEALAAELAARARVARTAEGNPTV